MSSLTRKASKRNRRMKKIDLKKLENLMIKNYKKQISFQELQKNFF